MTHHQKLLIAVGVVLLLGVSIAGGVWLRRSVEAPPQAGAAPQQVAAAPAPVVDLPPKPISFSLTDQDGRAVTEATYRGRWMLVYFGFTNCPDVCPLAMIYATDFLNSLGAAASSLQVVFVSVDPARDTPDMLKEYLGNFDSRIVGLSGVDQKVAEAAQAFGAYYREEPVGYTYTMDHSTAFYLVNPEGGLLRAFAPQNVGDDVTDEIKKTMKTAANDAGIVVTQAWMRASIGKVTATAAYATIENHSGKDDRLLSVSTPAAGSAELHEKIDDKGIMKMRPVTALTVAQGKTVELNPGGMHIMVTGLKDPLKAGDKVPLVLRFENAGEITVQADVRGLN